MIKTICIIVLFVYCAIAAVAQQNKAFVRESFNSDEDYKEALLNLKSGDLYYEKGKLSYPDAFRFYSKAYKLIPDNAELNYKMGVCVLLSMPDKELAVKHVQAAYELDNKVNNEIFLVLGKSFHANADFDKAIKYYKLYKDDLDSKNSDFWTQKINKWVAECNNGIEISKNPIKAEITNLGSNINTKWSDHSPLISLDESVMIFTSQRDSTTGGREYQKDKYFEDVYISENNGGVWSAPKNIGSPINTQDHDATVGISPDGQKLFIYRSNKNGGDLYQCEKDDEQWSEPIPLPSAINTSGQETSASFSPDGNIIYFISDRKDDNKGGKDIYYCRKENNAWGKAINIGGNVNTEYDEEGVFMHADGRTLFFSSKGHNTIGGFDIFKTVRDSNGVWSKPVNIGLPVNTPQNDIFYMLSASGEYGFLSSVRSEGFGEQDIYMVSYSTDEESDTLPLFGDDAKVTVLTGTVLDPETKQPVRATIEVIDIELDEVIFVSKSNKKTGKYYVALPSGREYGVVIDAEGYLFHSDNYNIPYDSPFTEIEQDVEIRRIEEGSNIVLKNIFFDYFSARLSRKSNNELQRIEKMLRTYPDMKIEISGHSDNTGPEDGNKRLSQSRAQSVANHLIGNGIEEKRLVVKGYGSSLPIADNSTPQGQMKNRRVEFKVLSK